MGRIHKLMSVSVSLSCGGIRMPSGGSKVRTSLSNVRSLAVGERLEMFGDPKEHGVFQCVDNVVAHCQD